MQITAWVHKEIQKLEEGTCSVLQKARSLDRLYSAGAVSWRNSAVLASRLKDQTCSECYKVVKGSAALASHRRKVHGVYSLGALLQHHTLCPVCMTEFWTPSRLWLHMRKSARCLHVFQSSDPDLGPNAPSDPKHAKLPAIKVPGPRMWWTHLNPLDQSDTTSKEASPWVQYQRLHHVWSLFQCELDTSADQGARISAIQRIWQEISRLLQLSGGSIGQDVHPLFPGFEAFQAILRACKGMSIQRWGMCLINLDDVCWIIPSEAKQALNAHLAATLA